MGGGNISVTYKDFLLLFITSTSTIESSNILGLPCPDQRSDTSPKTPEGYWHLGG